jgi:hypothetical protein
MSSTPKQDDAITTDAAGGSAPSCGSERLAMSVDTKNFSKEVDRVARRITSLKATLKPAAWALFYSNGSTASVAHGRVADHWQPLYRQPLLTEEEFDAVQALAVYYQKLCDEYGPSEEDEKTLAAVRRLLRRVKPCVTTTP